MRQIVTVGVRTRFSLLQIYDLWSEFNRQIADNPNENLFWVGNHTDWRNLYKQKVFVKIEQYPGLHYGKTGEKVATMLLSNEY